MKTLNNYIKERLITNKDNIDNGFNDILNANWSLNRMKNGFIVDKSLYATIKEFVMYDTIEISHSELQNSAKSGGAYLAVDEHNEEKPELMIFNKKNNGEFAVYMIIVQKTGGSSSNLILTFYNYDDLTVDMIWPMKDPRNIFKDVTKAKYYKMSQDQYDNIVNLYNEIMNKFK